MAPPQKGKKAVSPGLGFSRAALPVPPPKKDNKVSEGLRPAQRIRGPRVFKYIFENGVTARGILFKVWAYCDKQKKFEGVGPKIGIMVSRKTHLRANVRNLWKRRIRESFRKMQAKIKPECLIVISSRHHQKQVPAQDQIAKELERLLLKTESLME